MQPTLLEQLATWLDNRVYEAGVVLYQDIFGPGFLLTMLKTGPDDYNRGKLTAALETHYEQLVAEQQTIVSSYPESLSDEIEHSKLFMDERTAIKERMRVLYEQGITSGDQLKDCVFRILRIGDQLSDIYGRKDFFHQYGYMPDQPEDEAPMSETELVKRLLTVRTYVTKYKKRVDQAPSDSPDRKKLADKLAEFTSEAHHLQRQIDLLAGAQYDHVIHD